MAGIPTQIIQNLFGRDRLDDISLEDLKDLLNEYPSFNAVHFLLSKKLKMEGSNEFSQQTQTTALHFTNPFWLQFLLEKDANGNSSTLSELETDGEHLKSGEEQYLSKRNQAIMEAYAASELREQSSQASSDYTSISAGQTTDDIKIEHTSYPEVSTFGSMGWEGHEEEKTKNLQEEIPQAQEQMQDPDEMMEESLADIAMAEDEEKFSPPEFTTIEESHFTENIIPLEQETQEQKFSQIEALKANEHDSLEKMNEEINEWSDRLQTEEQEATNPHGDHRESERAEPEFSGQESELEMPVKNNEQTAQRTYYFWEKEFYSTTSEPAKPHQSEHGAVAYGQIPLEPERIEQDKMEQREFASNENAELISNARPEPESVIVFDQDPIILGPFATSQGESLPTIHESGNETESPLLASIEMPKPSMNEPLEEFQFTPYHTIDYFASQGIQYEQEENPTDKFGKQLKSFTAWLKSMKKLPKAVLEAEMSDITEAAIQSIAEHSIEEKEVITEAMAEVLVLQGKNEKAIELYRKLSLLNPAKSAFFAARIDQIKVN
jgi:hypothetical protein